MSDSVFHPTLPRALPLLLTLTAALAVAVPVEGQSPPPDTPGELVTDRPDQTESAAVVAPGFFQLEAGGLFTRVDEVGDDSIDVLEGPGTLARIGVGSRTELRLGWAGLVEVDANGETDGVADAELGAKVSLRTGETGGPAMALLAGVSLPVGDDEFTSDRYDPSFRLAVEHDLAERVSLGYNLGMAWSSEVTGGGPGRRAVRETFSRFVYTAALGFALSPRLGAFAEVFGEEPVDAPGSSDVSVDGGFTYRVRPNLQLDLFGGAGLTDDAADWFVGTGFVVRWPR